MLKNLYLPLQLLEVPGDQILRAELFLRLRQDFIAEDKNRVQFFLYGSTLAVALARDAEELGDKFPDVGRHAHE